MRLARHIPNLLTVLRLAAAPLTAYLLLEGRFTVAFAVFAFAALTDAADGYLAKRFNVRTRFGVYLDPAADKLLMLISFVVLTMISVAPLWLTALVITRDAAIISAVLVAKYFGLPLDIQPQPLGKACTFVQVSYVTLMLLSLMLNVDPGLLGYGAAIVTAVLTLASGLSYGHVWVRALFLRHSRPA